MPTSRLEPADCDETHTDDDNLEDRVDDNGSPPPPHYCLLSRGVIEISKKFSCYYTEEPIKTQHNRRLNKWLGCYINHRQATI